MLRGVLREHGIPIARGAHAACGAVPVILEGAEVALPDPLRHTLARIDDEVRPTERRLQELDRTLARIAATHPVARRHGTRFQHWAVAVAARRGHNKAAIAVANKLARIVWAVWHRDVDCEAGPQIARAA